jgi:hypothetical protein
MHETNCLSQQSVNSQIPEIVMLGLVPSIHAFTADQQPSSTAATLG